jgi:hypothetical protein
MRYGAAFPLVAAFLLESVSVPECANAQSSSNPYALDRLFLTNNDWTPLYDVLSFTNETEVANYYGANSQPTKLATEFFSNYTGTSATMLFTRYPELPARAHLYGANIRDLTLPQLQALNGNLTITSEGYDYSGSINLSGAKSFVSAARTIANALNKTLPTAAVTTNSSIAPVSAPFTGSISYGNLTVSALSPGNSIEIGSYISGSGIPAGAQITSQISGTPNGVGVYGLFVREGVVSSEPMTESYGVLTVGSVSSGTVAVGQQVTNGTRGSKDNILAHTAIEDYLGSSGSESTWVVDLAQSVSAENVTMTGAPLAVAYRAVTGATVDGVTEKTGYLLIQQWPSFNFTSSTLTYAGGSLAASLGLAEGSQGPDGTQDAFLSTPGQVVTSASTWMTNFVETEDPDWATFQTTYSPKAATPPGEQDALEDWAESTDGQYTYPYKYLKGYSANTPPIEESIDSNAVQLFAPTGSTVPEPSTWTMLLIGLAGLGCVGYRKAKGVRVAA